MSEPAFLFLRPWWLAAFVPILLLWLTWWRRRRAESAWHRLVDPALRDYVIEPPGDTPHRGPQWLLLGWAVCILLLSGPVWDRRDVPVFESRDAEVIVLDLSSSMLADDIQPNRLARARFKLRDLLDRPGSGQRALVAFSERAYVVSPLTDDMRTLKAFLPSLAPDVMPVQGTRLDSAIELATRLLQQSEDPEGHVMVLTDAEVTPSAIAATEALVSAGHRLSVLAVGTERGAPLRDGGGRFVRDENGAIVVPHVSLDEFRDLAAIGGGVATPVTSDSGDLERLLAITRQVSNAAMDSGLAADRAAATRLDSEERPAAETQEVSRQSLWWVEYAPWGVPFLALAALALFRRGLAF